MNHVFAGLGAAAVLLSGAAHAETLRIATYNASMNRANAGDLMADLASGTDSQIQAVAEIIQRVNPDILLINEFDYDPAGPARFVENYLNVPQNASGQGPVEAVDYAYTYTAPSNTGIASGHDLDNSGSVGGGNDAYGFGEFEGQYGMAVFSKYEIDTDAIRTFQTFLWKDMPDANLPADPLDADGNGDTENWYTAEELDAVRLSSKSHWDVPITIDGETLHFLVSHPTPPVYDGEEDRNGTRNSDEIRFWADYVAGEDYFYDDAGATGGLGEGEMFVIAGDMNSDPVDGDSLPGAANQLLDSAYIQAIAPTSAGGAEAAVLQGGANAGHSGDPAEDTGDFGFNTADPSNDVAPGNLRVDYVLPSVAGLTVVGSGVFWPETADPLSTLAAYPTSDHRLVWIDVEVAPPAVPVPGAIWLMAGALGGLVALRRRA